MSQVRDALVHLHDPAKLQTHPLARLFGPPTGARSPTAGKALRQSLLDAVEALRPGSEAPESNASRSYQVLELRHVQGLDPQEVERMLAVSQSEYYRIYRRALQAVASVLQERWELAHPGDELLGPASPRAVTSAALAEDTRVAEAPRSNLPAHLTSFVGREKEMAEVRQLLGTTRLLTVTGSGGSGKTRLAQEVAADLLSSNPDVCPDGVYLVELASLVQPELVPQSVALALGVREVSSQPILVTLLAYLRSRRLLLVLDNCEHLLDSTARLAESLLRGCPGLKIVATSREPLGIAGETCWRIPSLSLPEPSKRLSAEQLLEYEAVRLFVERTKAARPEFELTERNSPAVVGVCTRLDGMPLAIELAAARVRALSVEQLAQRLEDRFGLLRGGSRTALPRQQTLRATIEWSYDLLSEPERVLFRRLSVFSGGWTLEAAEGVCRGDGLSVEDILDLLIRLVDKSVVTVVEEALAEPRYRLLETIRHYAGEKLLDSGEETAVRDRHRDCYVRLVERAEPELVGPSGGEWLDRLERDYDNLRAVLEWCIVGEPKIGLKVAGGLWWFWVVRGYYTEGRQWLEEVLRRAPEPTAIRAKALVAAGSLAQYQSDGARAQSALEESLTISRENGDDECVARGLAELGILAFNRGEYTQAQTLLEEGLAATRLVRHDPSITLWLINRLGVAAHLAGDLGRAKEILDEGLLLARQAKSTRNHGWALGDLGNLLASLGEYDRARPLLEEGLAVSREIGDRQGLAWRLLHLGNLLRIQNEPGIAREMLEEALGLFQSNQSDRGTIHALAALANLERSEGRYDQARELLAESTGASLKAHDKRNISHQVWLLGILEVERGALARGTRLIGAGTAHGLRQTLSYPTDRADADAALSVAHAALGEEAFARAWAEGQAMTLEQAVEYALQDEAEA